MRFTEDVRRWRQRMKMTQAEAAEILEVSRRTYEGWEMGRHVPSHVSAIRHRMRQIEAERKEVA